MSESVTDVRRQAVDKLRANLYYFIIGMVSMLVLVFVPMIGTQAGIDFNIPDTTAGWLIYIITKSCVAMLNIVIFHSFMRQGKLNVRNDPKFLEAQKIMGEYHDVHYIPRSPSHWQAKEYGTKATSIFFSTALSLVGLSNAFLTYDYLSLLTYGMVIVMGIVFGIMQMQTAEEYWTIEFYDYALSIKHKKEIETNDNNRQ